MRNYRMLAFADELEKQSAGIGQAIGGLLKRPGVAATATSAAMGGLWQGDKGYQEAKERGEGIGGRITGALRRGAVGTAGGAAVGGGIAAGAKHLKGRAGNLARSGQKSLADLGGQQAHALTGVGTARQFGSGSALSKRNLADAGEHLTNMQRLAKTKPTAWRKWRETGAQKGLDRATKGHKATLEAERMGITSLPGTFKALRKEGPGKVLRTAWDSQIGGMGTGTKAFMFGVPAAIGVAGAMGAKPGEGGEAIGEAAGMAASNVAPMAMSPSMLGGFSPAAHLMPTYLMSMPFMEAGKQVGRGADWAVRKIRGGGAQ